MLDSFRFEISVFSVHESVCVCACDFMRTCACVHSVCFSVCVCVCVYVCVHVCIYIVKILCINWGVKWVREHALM